MAKTKCQKVCEELAAVATVARLLRTVMMLRQDKRISRLKRSCSEQRFVPECNPLFFNPCRKFNPSISRNTPSAFVNLCRWHHLNVSQYKLNAQTFLIQARSSFPAVTDIASANQKIRRQRIEASRRPKQELE